MGKPTGFLEIERRDRSYAPVEERLKHWHEFVLPLDDAEVSEQGARCMDCGIPYCHDGCPINNIIPDWNDLIYHGDYRQALRVLHSTNNFPEFTGRVCPAPCEAACTLNIENTPVTIKTIECAIIDKAWSMGWVQPHIPESRTGKHVAVVGSGPAGLACAQQLARAGHWVVVYEKNERIGGLLRYGIPDFKLEKHLIDSRMAQMQAEGVEFRPSTNIGVDISAAQLLDRYDAVVLSGGAEAPRDLPVPGRLKTALRIDDLLVNWPAAADVMAQAGHKTAATCDAAGRAEAKRFIESWVDRIEPLYMAASLGPDFGYPSGADHTAVLDEVLIPVAIERGLPIALMTGVKKAVNPPLGDGGDGVGTADVDAIANLCAKYPAAKFICTMLSRVNQHELCVVARKFGNLHVEGCWWFCNNPSIINEMTRMRLELLGTAFTAQHSDARVLDQLIYKWAHTRTILADVLAEKYADQFTAGWRPTTDEITRDVRALLGGSFEAFLAK